MTTVTMKLDQQSNELILDIQHRMDNLFVGGGNTTLLADKIINGIVNAVVDDFLTNNTLEIMKQLDVTAIAQIATTKAIMKLTEKIGNGNL